MTSLALAVVCLASSCASAGRGEDLWAEFGKRAKAQPRTCWEFYESLSSQDMLLCTRGMVAAAKEAGVDEHEQVDAFLIMLVRYARSPQRNDRDLLDMARSPQTDERWKGLLFFCIMDSNWSNPWPANWRPALTEIAADTACKPGRAEFRWAAVRLVAQTANGSLIRLAEEHDLKPAREKASLEDSLNVLAKAERAKVADNISRVHRLLGCLPQWVRSADRSAFVLCEMLSIGTFNTESARKTLRSILEEPGISEAVRARAAACLNLLEPGSLDKAARERHQANAQEASTKHYLEERSPLPSWRETVKRFKKPAAQTAPAR